MRIPNNRNGSQLKWGSLLLGFALFSVLIPQCNPPPEEKKLPPVEIKPETEAPPLYFPPESKPNLTGSFNLNELLNDYVTPYLNAKLVDAESLSLPSDVIALKFNYPIVEKEKLGIPSRAGIWSFVPYRTGTYRWHDETTLTFKPDRPWDAHAVGFLPGNTKSREGYKLAAPLEIEIDYTPNILIAGKMVDWEITPGEPQIFLLDPPNGGTIGNVPGISLVFDQPVLVDYVRKKLDLKVKNAGNEAFHSVDYTLVHPPNPVINNESVNSNYVILVKPAQPFPFQSDVKLVFMAGLKESSEVERNFKTPSALLLESVACQKSAACTVTEENSNQEQKISIKEGTGYLEIKFNDTLDEEASQGISINPAPASQKGEVVYKTLFLSWDWKPATDYSITFNNKLRNSYGFNLERKVGLTLQTRNLLPSIVAPIGLKTVDPEKENAITFKALNIQQVTLRKYPLDINEVSGFTQSLFASNTEDTFQTLPENNEPILQTFEGNHAENIWHEIKVSPEELMGDTGKNIFFIQYETNPFVPQTPEESKRLETLIQITEIGLTTKRLSQGLWVLATSLKTGEPLPGVNIQIVGPESDIMASDKTGEKGEVFFPLIETEGLLKSPLVLAQKENDSAFLWLGRKVIHSSFFELDPIITQSLGKQPESKPGIRGFIFTDRGSYNPGQKILIKGLLKKESLEEDDENSSSNIFEGAKVKLNLKQGEKVSTYETKVKAGNAFDTEIPLGKDVALGKYTLQAEWDETVIAAQELIVTDQKRNTFQLDVRGDQKELQLGDSWNLDVNAHYFFGTPVNRGKLQWTLYQMPIAFSPQGYDEYVFEDAIRHAFYESENGDFSLNEITSHNTGLAASGENRVTVNTSQSDFDDPETTARYLLNLTVTDESGQALSHLSEVIVHPVDTYVGLRRNTDYATQENITFDWVAITPKGIPVNGVEANAILYRLENHWFQEEGLEDDYYQETEAFKEEVARCKTVSNEGRQGCFLGLKLPGRYALVLESKDQKGRPITSSQEIFVEGSGAVSGVESKRHLLKPRIEQKIYQPGETAFVQFENPLTQARATLTVEKEGKVLLTQSSKITQGIVKLAVPVEESFIPNAYLGVHITAGRTGNQVDALGNDVSSPTYLSGYAPLTVAATQKTIQIDLEADKNHYLPRDEAKITVKLTDSAGQPLPQTELALFAVDEGILSMTDFQTPDPLKTFFPENYLKVELGDNRTLVYSADYHLSVLEKGQIGGDGGTYLSELQPTDIRSDFRNTIYWNPSIITDEKGLARVQFKLPDTMTRFRLIAVAHHEPDLYGNAVLPLTVAKPVFADITVPDSIVRGDSFKARLVLHNTTTQNKTAEISLTQPKKGTKTITIPQQGSEIIDFDIDSPLAGDHISFDAIVSSGETTDHVLKDISIRENFERKTRAIAGVAKKLQKVKLQKSSSWGEVPSLKLELSPLPFLDFENIHRYLAEWKNTQELASLIGALLLAEDEFKKLLPHDFFKRINGQVLIEDHLKILNDRFAHGEMPAGTFEKHYGAMILNLAALRGFKNNDSEKILKTLNDYVIQAISDKDKSSLLNPETQAFLTYIAALSGVRQIEKAQTLVERAEEMGPFALGLSILALERMGMTHDAKTLLTPLISKIGADGFITDKKYSPKEEWMGSEIRDLSVVAMALMAVDPKNELIESLIQRIFSAQIDGHWGNAQETYFAISTVGRFIKTTKSRDFPDLEIKQGEKVIDVKTLKTESKSVRETAISYGAPEELVFKLTDEKPVYFTLSAALDEKYSKEEAARVAQSIHIFKTIEDANGKLVDSHTLKLGEVYRWRIYVKTTERIPRFYLRYRVPAGVTPLDLSFSGNKQVSETEQFEGDRRQALLDRVAQYLEAHHVTPTEAVYLANELPEDFYCFDFYARATQPGNFLIPPVEAGSDYKSEFSGLMPAEEIHILP